MKIKLFAVAVCLTFTCFLSAMTVPGFIITAEGERLEGHIKITAICGVDAFRILGFEEVSLHASIQFRQAGANRFKEFFPEMINGYAFMHW